MKNKDSDIIRHALYGLNDLFELLENNTVIADELCFADMKDLNKSHRVICKLFDLIDN